MSSVFALPAYAYLAVAGNRKVLSKMDLRPLAVLVVLPALLYFWVYLRANSDPVYNWNNPNTLGRFIIHVSAYVHRQTYVFTYTSSEFFERFFGILYHYVKQYSLAGLLVLFGLYRHGGKNWVFLNFTAMLVAIDTFYALFLNEASLDITTFCLPSIIVLGIWSGFLFEDVFRWIRKETEDRMWQYAAVASVALFLVAVNYWTNDKSQNLIAYDYGMNVLKSTDQGAIIFADGDNVVLPLAYILYAEGARKDVTLYERGGLLSHKLYGEDYIFLDEQSHAKRQYEREYQLIKGNRPVYYTSDPEVDYPGYKLVQTGLIYRVVPENDTISDKDYFRLYDTRQVFNNTIYTDYMTNNIRASYYIRLAQYIGAGDKDRAIDILKQAQGILPDNMAIRYELGKLLLLKREYNGAIAEFKEAIRIDQKSAKAYLNLGSAYAQKGEFEAAKQGYLEALKLDPSYLKARFNLATILAAKNPAESINQYLIIIRSDPTYANAYFNLGMVYDSIGRKQEAKAMWSKYLEIQPNGQTASSARAKLAGGNSTTV
jgi:tetratricopeptide (TPR) repeat protein